MILQEKIKKKAEGFGKFAPAFIEGAKFALENQWISVNEDLPCNHEELMGKYLLSCEEKSTIHVLTLLPNGKVTTDSMVYYKKWWNGRQWDGEKWEWWSHRRPTHWMPIPKLPKE